MRTTRFVILNVKIIPFKFSNLPIYIYICYVQISKLYTLGCIQLSCTICEVHNSRVRSIHFVHLANFTKKRYFPKYVPKSTNALCS